MRKPSATRTKENHLMQQLQYLLIVQHPTFYQPPNAHAPVSVHPENQTKSAEVHAVVLPATRPAPYGTPLVACAVVHSLQGSHDTAGSPLASLHLSFRHP